MSIYVDPLLRCIPNPNWKWSQSCHLFSDNENELHEFAKSIGLKREWFQNAKWPHYDLNSAMRNAAVQAGAIEVDRREAVYLWVEFGYLPRRIADSPEGMIKCARCGALLWPEMEKCNNCKTIIP